LTAIPSSAAESKLAAEPPRSGNDRDPALDRLRGGLVLLSAVAVLAPSALREWPDNAGAAFLVGQLEPSTWHGVTLFDLLQPGFLFVMGMAATLSVDRRRNAEESSAAIVLHLLGRCAVLFLIGLVLDGGLTAWPDVRWLGPWQRVAICNLCAGSLCLVADWKLLLPLAALILINYGMALEMYPASPPPTIRRGPAAPLDPYSNDYNLAASIDQRLLPGRKYFGKWDPQGLLTTLPALATALLGAALRQATRTEPRWIVILIGAALINTGWLLGEWQPLNAWLMTPPFVLVSTGILGLAWGGFSLIRHSPAVAPPNSVLKKGDRHRLIRRICDENQHAPEPVPVFQQPAYGTLVNAGQNCLVLMIVLSLIGKFESSVLSGMTGELNLSRFYPHTGFAVVALASLGWLSAALASTRKVAHDASKS
jgi:predicted acyltransferase